jgi:membrane associated rhomboid family serine protease
MIPISDDDRYRRTTPVVTYILIAINVIVFLLELAGGDAFIERWSFVPANFAANPAGAFITIFTAMFMHGGWAHLLGNMLYLWIFGDNVEDRLGHVKYLLFYLLCGVAATFAQMLVNPGSHVPNLGASGAIAGVLGAYIVMFPQGRVNVLLGRQVTAVSALIVIGFWFVLQLFSSFGAITAAGDTGGVAYMAHVGGFVAGILLTFLMGGRNPRLTSSTGD